MKKLISLVLCLGMLMGILSLVSFAGENVVIGYGAEWDAVTYEWASDDEDGPDAPSGWLNSTDSETWTKKTLPLCVDAYSGYHNHGELTHTIIEGFNAHRTFLRKTFTLTDASDYKVMTLSVIYDEAPVIYINGEEVWTASGYHDSGYVTVDLSDKLDTLKDGKNTVCVKFENSPTGGGSMMDLSLKLNDTGVNADGTVIATGATCDGIVGFGDINDPKNVLDGNNDSCCGSGWDANATMSVTVNFLATVNLEKVKVACKNEGAPESGAWGTYDVYALNGETETKIGTINAMPDGTTVELDDAVEANGVKIVITSWNGSAWAAIADVWAYGSDIGGDTDTPDTPVEPPKNGDATVFAVVFAAVAMFGMAVVVTKKVNA